MNIKRMPEVWSHATSPPKLVQQLGEVSVRSGDLEKLEALVTELLAALEALVKTHIETCENDGGYRENPMEDHDVMQANAAIAKATKK